MSTLGQIVNWIIIAFLVILSGIFSGLNLGLMGLDSTHLELLVNSDPTTYEENVAVNAILSILLAEYTGGLIGFFVSTALIVIIGETVP